MQELKISFLGTQDNRLADFVQKSASFLLFGYFLREKVMIFVRTFCLTLYLTL